MPTVRIPIDLAWTGASGSPGVNVFHARIGNDPIEGDDLETITEWLHTFYEDQAGLFPGGVTIRFAGEAYGVGDDQGDVWNAPTWTVVGDGAGGFMPPANCLLVSWRTNSGGNNGRGRTFLGPIAQWTEEGNGTPDEAVRAGLQLAVDNLVASSTAFQDGALGVYSRTEDVFRDFTSGTVPNMYSVLRSRRD